MSAPRRQAGFLALAALVLMVIVIALAIAMGFLLANSTLASGARLGSMQAFFLAESGLEYEQRRWAQNLNWYRSAADPDPAAPAPQGLAGGAFTVSTNLPATMLRTRMTIGANTMNVYTTARFPASGLLQVDDDVTANGELVSYAGIAGASFTGVARAQTVGSVTTVASAHARSANVYPVTILRTVMPANCNPLASIDVDAHAKFLGAGTLDIEGEEIGYAGSTTTGGTMTLTGITRCLGTVSGVAHAVGEPVTPVLVGGDSANAQVEISSVGTLGGTVRYARRTVQR